MKEWKIRNDRRETDIGFGHDNYLGVLPWPDRRMASTGVETTLLGGL
jgi:hypothetical protein